MRITVEKGAFFFSFYQEDEVTGALRQAVAILIARDAQSKRTRNWHRNDRDRFVTLRSSC